MKVRQFHPFPLMVDGEEISLRIKRMDVDEYSEFRMRYVKVVTPTAMKYFSRAPTGPEQQQNDKGEYILPFEIIVEKRLEHMTMEKRAEYESSLMADEKEAKSFFCYMFDKFVKVEKGLIEEQADGTEVSVKEGLDLLRIFGARRDVLQQVFAAVREENEMDADQKKASRSPVVSSRTSTGRRRVRAGKKRGTTAKRVETGDSADNVAATASRGITSGLTETSPSSPVPSIR
jgi:hypothetical protein